MQLRSEFEEGVPLAVMADATPHAASLIESLRDIGYSCRTAMADIIDNAITAQAGRVDILCDTLSEEPMVGLLDDGVGMSRDQLIEAMRPGSRNPLETRMAGDLGRFGLGLKSASFSQCRMLTVITRRHGITVGATWDLDAVARSNRWEIALHDDCSTMPWIERLGDHGTLVLWRQLDRLSDGIADQRARAVHVERIIAETARHLRVVFHRFMEGTRPRLEIRLNDTRLMPIDPFGQGLKGHQADPVDQLHLPSGVVEFQSHTLPHHSGITRQQWEELGGPGGHLRSQGFYVYRGGRLIIAGSWLGLARQMELTKLCRIRVDIPNTMDAEWKIDVKKASAQFPPPIRERMRVLIERLSGASRRTYQRRGQRLVDDTLMPLWQRIARDGAIIYRPDPGHPLITDLAADLPPALQERFLNLVHLLGASVPVASLHADFAGSPEDVRPDQGDAPALEQLAEAMIPRFLEQGISPDTIRSTLRQAQPWSGNWTVASAIVDAILARHSH